MNPVSRGIRGAFRSGLRSVSIIAILGLSAGLALTMLVAQKAVENKIASVKRSVGNTVTITPAGFTPGSATNNALTTASLDSVKSLDHVTGVTETLTDRQSTTGSSNQSFGPREQSSSSSTTTSLTSPVTLNREGQGRFMAGGSEDGSTDTTTTFSLPVSFLGTTNPAMVSNTAVTLSSGTTIDGATDSNDVLISEAMATKNNLQIGSTFTAYDATLNVKGIFKTSNRSDENTVVMSLGTLQRLSGQSGVVTSAVATVDSLDNLSGVTSAIGTKLGSSADVTSAQEQADATVKPLNSVRSVATYSLIGALIAGTVIILLIMVMIVRERKREIAVAKAIGGSNVRIAAEFMVEAVTLAVLGAIIGLIIGVVGGQPVTKQLVASNTANSSVSTSQDNTSGSGRVPGSPSSFNGSPDSSGGGMGREGIGQRVHRNDTVRSFTNIKAQVGPAILLQGFASALAISIIGSGLAAVIISKIRPSTVMRSE